MRSVITSFFALVAALVSGCVTADRFAEFQRYEREANGRFIGVLGFALTVPGVEDFEKHYSYKRDVLVIPKTTDSFEGEEELDYNRRAEEFARRYNLRLLRQGKKPNQSSEPTPTSVTPRADARVAPAAVAAHL